MLKDPMPVLHTLVSGLASILDTVAAPLPLSATPFSGLRPANVDVCYAEPGTRPNNSIVQKSLTTEVKLKEPPSLG